MTGKWGSTAIPGRRTQPRASTNLRFNRAGGYHGNLARIIVEITHQCVTSLSQDGETRRHCCVRTRWDYGLSLRIIHSFSRATPSPWRRASRRPTTSGWIGIPSNYGRDVPRLLQGPAGGPSRARISFEIPRGSLTLSRGVGIWQCLGIGLLCFPLTVGGEPSQHGRWPSCRK
jgi:hypothetical protein